MVSASRRIFCSGTGTTGCIVCGRQHVLARFARSACRRRGKKGDFADAYCLLDQRPVARRAAQLPSEAPVLPAHALLHHTGQRVRALLQK
jgi:hypothetical protein